jgi:hypothetical protein
VGITREMTKWREGPREWRRGSVGEGVISEKGVRGSDVKVGSYVGRE